LRVQFDLGCSYNTEEMEGIWRGDWSVHWEDWRVDGEERLKVGSGVEWRTKGKDVEELIWRS
jgi:hypothetical protein